MRIIANIPHPKIAITLFQMNDKYILKLEAGMMEQAYKFKQEHFSGPDDIKKMVTEEFLSQAIEHFNAMYKTSQQFFIPKK